MGEQRKRRRRDHGAFASDAQVGGMLGNRRTADSSMVFQDLRVAQQVAGQITEQSVHDTAKQTSRGVSAVRGVATFYSLFEVGEPHEHDTQQTVARLCDGPTCCLRGGQALLNQLSDVAAKRGDLRVERSSCLGLCEQAPAALVVCNGHQRAIGHASAETIASMSADSPPTAPLSPPAASILTLPTASTDRQLTARFPSVARRSSEPAVAAGAYQVLRGALSDEPRKIIDEVESSGLRGRGGAGFVTGKKWRMAANVTADRRIVVCNADESEPGTFKDRMLMENDPHLLLEGMAICARGIGASEGYIYIRGEYLRAAETLEQAIDKARREGWLGRNIRHTGFDFDVHLHRGAGAYICGEETALLESMEGKRGEPRERPPYPVTCGYQGFPTVVNNVETLCAVPSIVSRGHLHFRDLGRRGSFGTKLFCLSGHVANPGMCEAPSGVSLRELIWQYGGGVTAQHKFKFALTGGAAGTFVPESMLDLPMSHDSWADGLAVGSGAVIVADETVNAVEMLLWVTRFFERESCGKCTPCRIGSTQARQLVEAILTHGASRDDIARLRKLARTLDQTSLCGLGQSIAWPIESAIKHSARTSKKA